MTTFPRSPKILKGGIVLIDPDTSAVQQIIALQYNPETLSRTLKAQSIGETADRSQILRLKGAPEETYKLDAVIDVADQPGFPKKYDTIIGEGILPQSTVLNQLNLNKRKRR